MHTIVLTTTFQVIHAVLHKRCLSVSRSSERYGSIFVIFLQHLGLGKRNNNGIVSQGWYASISRIFYFV